MGWPLGSRLWCLSVKLSLSHWYIGSGVVLDCIDSWSLPSFLLWPDCLCNLMCWSKWKLTLYILIDFPKQISAIRVLLSTVYYKGHRSEFLNYGAVLSLKVVLTSTKCENTDFLWATPPLSPTPRFPPLLFIFVCVVIPFLLWHFICIFTVCQSTHLGVSNIQRVINDSLRMTQDEELYINVYYRFIHFLIYNLQSIFSHILYRQQFIFSWKYFHMITNILHR